MLLLQNKSRMLGQTLMISVEKIEPNPYQPRKFFDPDELKALSDSIRENGILQPLSVRNLPGGVYELVAGERRLRAAKLAGLKKVPCIEVRIGRMDSAVFALIENIQRKDLNFFEEAEAINALIENHGISQEECASRLGKAQSTLSNKLRLLRLSPEIRKKISESGLTERHARALLRLESAEEAEKCLEIIINRNLNVAESDKLIDKVLEPPKGKFSPRGAFRDYRIFINTLNGAVKSITGAGVPAVSSHTETEDYIEYVVRINKRG